MQSVVPPHNSPDLQTVTGSNVGQDSSLSLRVENIVTGEYSLNNAFYKKYIVVSQDYGVSLCIHMDEGGFSFENFQLELRVCVDAIYRDGAYFERLDNGLLETALYGTEEELRSIIDPMNHTIKICSGIRKMTDIQTRSLEKIYGGKIKISPDFMEVTFAPSPFDYIKKQLGESFQSNEMFILRSDLFHAYFWGYGIRYYGKSTFLKQINLLGRDKLDDVVNSLKGVIAIGKKVTETRHDTKMDYEAFDQKKGENEKNGLKNPVIINLFPPLKVKRRPVLVNGKVAPGGEMECIFPKAEKDQCILEIILGELGKSGMTISGQTLPYAEIKHITILDLLDATHSEYVHIDETTDSKKIRIIANENVYVLMDKQGKLGFSRHKKYKGDIGPKTGSLSLPMDGTAFELIGDIGDGYFIKGFDIVYSGKLYGNIFAQNNVLVKGGGVLGGTIIAEKGDIVIDENVRIQDGTRLEAINGRVTIKGHLNNATIIASNIEVLGTATNCTFIGGNVSVEENNGRSKIMAETFSIKNDKSGEAEYTVLVYAGIHGLINTLEQEIKNSEGKGILEASRIANIGKLLDGSQNLINGTIHLDAKIQFLVIPFLIQESLFELLKQNNHPTVLSARKKHGLLGLVSLDTRADGIICKRDSLPLTRTKTITLLEERLQSRHIPREERNPLYMRGVRIKATVGQLGGNIFDYTSNGCSFILLNNAANSGGNIMKDSTIDVSILDHPAVSFFVTRAENREVKGVNYTFVAGIYLAQGTEQEINKAVTKEDVKQKNGIK